MLLAIAWKNPLLAPLEKILLTTMQLIIAFPVVDADELGDSLTYEGKCWRKFENLPKGITPCLTVRRPQPSSPTSTGEY